MNESDKCKAHGNFWSKLCPVEMGWSFSDDVKIAHTSLVMKIARKIYFRKTAEESCDCKLMYEGKDDFLLRIGGSVQTKNARNASLVSYGLLMFYTIAGRQTNNEQTRKDRTTQPIMDHGRLR